MAFITAYEVVQQWGIFDVPCTASPNHGCSGTSSENKKGSLGRFTTLLMTCSWKLTVLGLTHCHEAASLRHTVAVTLWHFDESSVSACWYRVYDTIPSLLLSIGTSSETVKTLWRLCKTECEQRRLTERCCDSKWKRSFFFGFTWHHSIMVVICRYLDAQRSSWKRERVYLLAWCDAEMGIKWWLNLSVKSS